MLLRYPSFISMGVSIPCPSWVEPRPNLSEILDTITGLQHASFPLGHGTDAVQASSCWTKADPKNTMSDIHIMHHVSGRTATTAYECGDGTILIEDMPDASGGGFNVSRSTRLTHDLKKPINSSHRGSVVTTRMAIDPRNRDAITRYNRAATASYHGNRDAITRYNRAATASYHENMSGLVIGKSCMIRDFRMRPVWIKGYSIDVMMGHVLVDMSTGVIQEEHSSIYVTLCDPDGIVVFENVPMNFIRMNLNEYHLDLTEDTTMGESDLAILMAVAAKY